jgi:hypothetical protein
MPRQNRDGQRPRLLEGGARLDCIRTDSQSRHGAYIVYTRCLRAFRNNHVLEAEENLSVASVPPPHPHGGTSLQILPERRSNPPRRESQCAHASTTGSMNQCRENSLGRYYCPRRSHMFLSLLVPPQIGPDHRTRAESSGVDLLRGRHG